ncbi:MAG: hypothetical protein KGH53_03525 [Candidatus Micrarchaeota archaeon]|nr:hypothetical protein [Candidatus Micrarchaeota archaeon]
MDQIKFKGISEKKALEILCRKPEEVKVLSAVEKTNDWSGRDKETVITFVERA